MWSSRYLNKLHPFNAGNRVRSASSSPRRPISHSQPPFSHFGGSTTNLCDEAPRSSESAVRLDKLVGTVDNVRGEMGEVNRRLAELRQRKAQLQQRLQSLNNSNVALRGTETRLNSERSEWQQRLSLLQEECALLTRQLMTDSQRVKNSERQLREREEEPDALVAEFVVECRRAANKLQRLPTLLGEEGELELSRRRNEVLVLQQNREAMMDEDAAQWENEDENILSYLVKDLASLNNQLAQSNAEQAALLHHLNH